MRELKHARPSAQSLIASRCRKSHDGTGKCCHNRRQQRSSRGGKLDAEQLNVQTATKAAVV
jgi:hypothetical protein